MPFPYLPNISYMANFLNLLHDSFMGILKVNPHLHLKKISLKIWSLRDQVEALIRDKLEKSQENDISIDDYKMLIKKFNEEWILEDFFWEKTPKEVKTEVAKIPDPVANPTAALATDSALAPTPTPTPTPTPPATPDVKTEKKEDKEDKKSIKEIQSLIQERIEDYEKEMMAILNKRPRPTEEKIAKGGTFLTDVDFKSINFFSSSPFLIGQSILIEFKVPERFIMSAEVVRCLNYNLQSRIISNIRPNYRIQARFSFKRVGERTLLRKFLKGVMPDFSKDKKKAAAAASEASAPSADGAAGAAAGTNDADTNAALGDIAAMLGGGGAAAT